MESLDQVTALKAMLKVGDTIGFEPGAKERYRIIGTTGNIIKCFDAAGGFHLLSFAQLAQFAAEERLVVNGVKHTPRG